MISCDRATNLFGQSWDDELSVDEREALETHFVSCPACQRSYDEFARTLELVQQLPRPQVSDDFADRVLREARARELGSTRREGRPAIFAVFGGRLAMAGALAATIAVGAFVLSRPQGESPAQKPAPVAVAVRPAQPLPTSSQHLASGDPDGPVTAMAPLHTSAAQPAATTAAAPRTVRPTRSALPGSAMATNTPPAIPDSLFDHSADVDFVLDPVKVRRERGRGYTPVTNPVKGETASITF
jgi:hypothetical protein